MDHSAGTFVFDPQGRLRLYVGHGQGRRRLRARHLRELLRDGEIRELRPDAPHACSRRSRHARSHALARALDQLDLVAVRILHERDHRRAALHRARLARDRCRPCAHRVAGRRGIVDLDRDVAEARAEVVAVDAVVVRELEHGAVATRRRSRRTRACTSARADRSCAAASCRARRVEIDRPRQVADAQHRVQYSHRPSPPSDASELDHLEVFLARAAFGTGPVRRHVLPFRSRRDAFLGRAAPRRRSSRRSGTCIFSLRRRPLE